MLSSSFFPAGAIDCAAEPITVTVLGIKGNQVRIGIEAPADITILREELVPNRQPKSEAI